MLKNDCIWGIVCTSTVMPAEGGDKWKRQEPGSMRQDTTQMEEGDGMVQQQAHQVWKTGVLGLNLHPAQRTTSSPVPIIQPLIPIETKLHCIFIKGTGRVGMDHQCIL